MKREENAFRKRLSAALWAKRNKCALNSPFASCLLWALFPCPLPWFMSLFSLQPLLPHYSFLLSADTAPSPPSSYRFLDPFLLHHLILNIRNPFPPYNPETWAFPLLHWAPGTLSAFSHVPGWGQESLWLQRRPSTFQETAFLPFMLADGMIWVGKMESPVEECGKSGCTSTPRLSITIRMVVTEPVLGTTKAGRSQTCSNRTLFFFSFQ